MKPQEFKVRLLERHTPTLAIVLFVVLYSFSIAVWEQLPSANTETKASNALALPNFPLKLAPVASLVVLVAMVRGLGPWTSRYSLDQTGIRLSERNDWGARTPVSHSTKKWHLVSEVIIEQTGKIKVMLKSGGAVTSYWPVERPGLFEEVCESLRAEAQQRPGGPSNDCDPPEAPRTVDSWSFFISHAWEDKEDFVRPLANELRSRGIMAWYDEYTLRIGDSIRRSIDRGLAGSRFGIVVISAHSLTKEWANKEVDALFAKEADGRKVLLPIWHGVTREQVAEVSPMLADRFAVGSGVGVSQVVDQLLAAADLQTSRGPA